MSSGYQYQPHKMYVLFLVVLRKLASLSFQEHCRAKVGYRHLVLLIKRKL